MGKKFSELGITRVLCTIGSYHWIGKYEGSGYNIYYRETCGEDIYGPFFLYFGDGEMNDNDLNWCVEVSNFNHNDD